ncbi:MAG: hypothetical protein WC484_03365 [Candidatus Omnitrophota bacterium]
MESLKGQIFNKLFLSDSTPTYDEIADNLGIKRTQVVKEAVDGFRNNPDNRNVLGDIKRLKGLFNNKRKIYKNEFKFRSFEEFYRWYKNTYNDLGGACKYCGTPEGDIKKLVVDLSKSKRAVTRGRHLEIERRNSSSDNNEYSPDNCTLCCYICNNAKSDIFQNEQDFITIGAAIGEKVKGMLLKNV